MNSEISAFDSFLSPSLRLRALEHAGPVPGVPGLKQIGPQGGLETTEAMRFLVDLFEELKLPLNQVLQQRAKDRAFIDERTRAMVRFNRDLKRDFLDDDYQTPIGLSDGKGRIVMGPKRADFAGGSGAPVAPIPEWLQGAHVTLFGPPDGAKLAINAMNCYHRQLPQEPAIVRELLADHPDLPKWGADDEDSKTPMRQDLIEAGENLTGCFEGTLKLSEKGKSYELAPEKRALPIKRFPGLAMPCAFLYYQGTPVPLHLYDFALHFFHHWHNPKALCFYVPKLETEEEARYIRLMLEAAERRIQQLHPGYTTGSIRLMVVLENPRMILRTHELMDELYPYFAGASLGWHDYLASTARLFKEDPNYRIPVKADPNIVIKYIKASHNMLAQVVGPRGGIKIGGMYGILPVGSDLQSESFQLTLKGYFKDVFTQLKRGLDGFWVAHPDFVRLGLAMVEAWRQSQRGDKTKLERLVKELLPQHQKEILDFIQGPDIEGLDVGHPRYVRSLLVADIKESSFIANNHPDEIRYNVFQSLQYLADWLAGNGCVALPAQLGGVPVRVMDDLATAERSRWEVWHEIYHGRFELTDFLRIAHEELNFIRRDLSDAKKIVHVKWDERTAKWYPVAFNLMLKLMTERTPVEFATELLLPFTLDEFRRAENPWDHIVAVDPDKYGPDPFVARFNYWFERCGVMTFAARMAQHHAQDNGLALKLIDAFTDEEILAAASFHGDIGGGQKTLDHLARGEQALVLQGDPAIQQELAQLGEVYKSKFGRKFLVSAQGKSGPELLSVLKERLTNPPTKERALAIEALQLITLKRLEASPFDQLQQRLEELRVKHHISAAQVSLAAPGLQTLALGDATEHTFFQVASLSKTVASALALEFFRERGIALDTPVNELLAQAKSTFRIGPAQQGDLVQLQHLMNHTALNMHYVQGVTPDRPMPDLSHWLKQVSVQHAPGEVFAYSGGGFLVLEHLLLALSGKTLQELTTPFLKTLGMDEFNFEAPRENVPGTVAHFPAFAAGAVGSARSMHRFLQYLARAFNSPHPPAGISHDTARVMLHGFDKGCRKFMGCLMGLGVFIGEAGENRFMIHQGANDGFRALYLHCYQGPDLGKGLVVLARGELNAVLFNAEVTQEVLRSFNMRGVDLHAFKGQFATDKLRPEEVVNIGYKQLVFDAFVPTRAPEITDKGEKDPLAAYNLAANGRVLEVSNDRFARAENLLSEYFPKFDPELFCFQGKVMDSWESVRHNPLDRDTLIFEMKRPEGFRYVLFSTKYHLGNQAPSVRLSGRMKGGEWVELVEQTTLEGHALKRIDLGFVTDDYQEIKVEMFPDGGLTRLGLYPDLPAAEKSKFLPLAQAKNKVFTEEIPKSLKPLSIPFAAGQGEVAQNRGRIKTGETWDVASSAFGAKVLSASNEHYSPASQVISPFAPLSMFDGMESARSRKPGNSEEVVIKLAEPSVLKRLVFDFTYFVNNNPKELSAEGLSAGQWIPLVPRRAVKAFAGNALIVDELPRQKIEQVRIVTYPDGGLNRFHAYAVKELP